MVAGFALRKGSRRRALRDQSTLDSHHHSSSKVRARAQSPFMLNLLLASMHNLLAQLMLKKHCLPLFAFEEGSISIFVMRKRSFQL